mmetsp:Transcript_16298/g.22767  ORF Transcript_16298/g.22767 Transcript_16298/m.22767 type:complete len:435 (+) Transcript_16298:111-1415(+)
MSAEQLMMLQQLQQERLRQFEANSIEIQPEPGFVVKLNCSHDSSGHMDSSDEMQVCLNICQSPHIAPISETPDPSGSGAVHVRLPMSCGPMRREKARAASECAIFDVVLNDEVVLRCTKDTEFRENVASFAFQNVQRKFPVKAISSFTFPKIRYIGTKPGKQRIRKPKEKKVQEVGPVSTPSGKETLAAGENKIPPSQFSGTSNTFQEPGGKSTLFQAKIPKPREPPLSQEEKLLLDDFRKQMPDLKPEELRRAISMFRVKEAEKQKEKEAKEKVETKPKALSHSVYCRTRSGMKVRLESFLGRFFVRAAGFEGATDCERYPLELMVYIRLPALIEGLESLKFHLSENRLLCLQNGSEKKNVDPETDPSSKISLKYFTNIKLPFLVDTKKACIKYSVKQKKLSVRFPVIQPKKKDQGLKQNISFKNPFVFKFVA